MKKSSFKAQQTKSIVYCPVVSTASSSAGRETYLVGVVLVHDPASRCPDILVALALASHRERGIHVHVVAGEVQADQALEDYGISRLSGRQKDEQACGRATICHHVQHGAEARTLLELPRCHSIQSVQ